MAGTASIRIRRTPARRAAKDMVCEGGNLQKNIDRGDESDQENRKPADELHGRDGSGGLERQNTDDEISDDVDDRGGNDFIKGILQETAEPAPEEPLQFRNNEERHKDRSNKNAHGGGDESIGNDDDGDGLCGCEKNHDDHVNRHAEYVGNTGGVDARLEITDAVNNGLQLGLVNAVGEELGFVRNQIVET